MNKEVRNWLIKAFEDYRVVRHEMNLPEDEIVTSSVCFHCQQFVEKLLKAYLISKGIEFERTHTVEEARRSFEIAQDVKEFVLEKLGIKEDEIR